MQTYDRMIVGRTKGIFKEKYAFGHDLLCDEKLLSSLALIHPLNVIIIQKFVVPTDERKNKNFSSSPSTQSNKKKSVSKI